MNYIIDPWWIYLINVCNNLACVAAIIAVGSIIAGIVALYFYNTAFDEEEEASYKPLLKIFAIIFIVSVAVSIFCPSKETLYAMLTAKIATVENIELTVEGLKSVFDYIVETVGQLGA